MKTNYQNTKMLDMIFEHRNKSYGAYALRNDYGNRISNALLITLSLVSFLCFGKFLSDKMKGNKSMMMGTVVTLDPIPEVHIEKPEIKIEQQQKPPQAQALNTIRDPEMNVVANNQVQDSMPTNEQLSTAEAGLATNVNDNTIGVTDGRGTEETFTVTPAATPVAEPVRTWAEIMPIYPGGEGKLMDFVRKNTVYPDRERDLEIDGKALIKFVVNEDGSVSNVQVVKSDSPGFGKEGVRVAKLLAKFAPGMQQGKPVKVQFVLPFQFALAR
jgi:protein TonB